MVASYGLYCIIYSPTIIHVHDQPATYEYTLYISNPISSLHLSLSSCFWKPFNRDNCLKQNSFFNSNSNVMLQASMVVHSKSTSFESSLFFILKSLGSSPSSSPLARHWSLTGVPSSSPFFFSSSVKVVHLKRDGGGIWTLRLPSLYRRINVLVKLLHYIFKEYTKNLQWNLKWITILFVWSQ